VKNYFLALVLALFVFGCGGGSGPADEPSPPPSSGPSPSDLLANELEGLPLNEFYEVSYGALTYRSPETIVWQALTSVYPLDDVSLNDYSDAFRRETYAMYQVVLDALRQYDRSVLSETDQLAYDFYEWYLQDTVDSLEFIYYDFAAAYNFNGVHTGTETFFTEVHPLETIQDAEEYIARLQDVPRKFDALIDYLTRQSGAGIVEPRLSLDWSLFGIEQIANAAAGNVSYYTAFRDKVELVAGASSADKERLRNAALAATRDDVIPAYQALRNKLQELRGSAPSRIGVGQYPRGSEYYAYMLRHRTTTNLSAAEIHQLGLTNLQRIHAEMRVIFNELGYPRNETLLQSFQRVAEDGGTIPAADVKTTYEAIIAAAEQDVVEAFDIFPSSPVVVADDEFGGYYISPSFDGTRPGTFYASTRFNEPWFQMKSLTYHEAVPGHHTQIAIAMDNDSVPSFRRTVRFTAFVEGWALYAERLAYELGWYDSDPYGNLGRLQYEALRAARLVMDTGIHSLGWSFEQAVQFNIDNVGMSRGASEGAAARYSVTPAQASAYMVGMLRILDARQRAQDELGDGFDLKEFHRVVLRSGGLPLDLMDAVIDDWIAGQLAAP
jgi:uncharacterized protein (DUF885 family)